MTPYKVFLQANITIYLLNKSKQKRLIGSINSYYAQRRHKKKGYFLLIVIMPKGGIKRRVIFF